MSLDPLPTRAGWLDRLANPGGVEGAGAAALCWGQTQITYATLSDASRATLSRLRGLGIESGDLVAILAPPSIEGVILIHALLAEGVVFLPINARLAEDEKRRALRSTRPRFLVVAENVEGGDSELRLGLVRDSGIGVLTFAPGDGPAASGLALSIALDPSAAVEADALRRRGERVAESAAMVLQTSGTSGQPKGALLSFDNLMASAAASAALLGSRSSDRWLLCMPLFHIGGLSILIRSALAGARVFLQPAFDPEEVGRVLEAEGITHVSFVATMLSRLLEVRGEQRSPDSLRLVLLGGGPASSSLLYRGAELGYPIAPTYGLTEAASQVATRPPGDTSKAGDDLAGGLVALPGISLRVVDGAGEPVALGEEGEIEVSGATVMVGYLDDPAATGEAIRQGWLRTGDIGRLDREGRLRVLDRRSDLILSGGENVYPAEIESMLLELAGIRESGVFGIADSVFGERGVAVIVMEENCPFDPEALSAFCRERMAGYKRPAHFIQADVLPRTATGKLRRSVLRDEFADRIRDRR